MPSDSHKIIPSNADTNYFKKLVDTYNYKTFLHTHQVYDFGTYLKNYSSPYFYDYYNYCTFPVLHKPGKLPIRNQLGTATQYVGAYAEKDSYDRVCTNCGQNYLVWLDLEPQEFNPRCEIVDGTGKILRTWREHQTQMLSYEKRAKMTPRNIDASVCKVVAIHGDLIYTTGGLEIIGLYLVDSNFNLLLSETVPFRDRIVNSGYPNNNNVRMSKIGNFSCTLKELQEKVNKLIDSQTLVIGYNLAPVLRALELDYSFCVDLSIATQFKNSILPLKEYLFGLSQDINEIGVLRNNNENKKSTEKKASAYMAIMLSLWNESKLLKFKKSNRIDHPKIDTEHDIVIIKDHLEDDGLEVLDGKVTNDEIEIVEFTKKVPDEKLSHRKERKIKNNQSVPRTDGTEKNFYLTDSREPSPASASDFIIATLT
uniref:Exonuclease domain-containing protein n=1 Tax=Rhabditophanes sp. KR3021 TaxID=114890 RepID=A0AC35U001_9BILA